MQKCTILHYHIYSAEILLHSEKGEDERGERESERGERDRARGGRVDHREQGRGRRRARVRVGEDPKTNYTHRWTGQLHRHHHSNWRKKNDITTYYFTRFPDHTMVKDLWTHFKKWGDEGRSLSLITGTKGGEGTALQGLRVYLLNSNSKESLTISS